MAKKKKNNYIIDIYTVVFETEHTPKNQSGELANYKKAQKTKKTAKNNQKQPKTPNSQRWWGWPDLNRRL